MSGFKRFELLEPSSSLFYRESFFPFLSPSPLAGAVEEQLGFALDFLNPSHSDLSLQCLIPFPTISPLDCFEGAADLIHLSSAFKRLQERSETELYVRSLSDRVGALELGFDRVMRPKIEARDRKYKWTAEIEGRKGDGFDRKYKWMAEAKVGKEKSFKWTAEIKGKGKNAPVSRTYTFQASTEPTEKAETVAWTTARAVEIEEPANQGPVAVRKAFAKRAVYQTKGKRKELSPQDAASMIQMSFRAHLVRRSQVLRGLRDLAAAKAKLKEIRALFSNFSYRHRIANDAEERQRFSEKIIVLLLTIDAIEGTDYMVRAAKRSMVEELEAMLEVVDPQPAGKLGWMGRRKFDLPAGGSFSKEMARGVAEVVQMLDEEDNSRSSVLPDISL